MKKFGRGIILAVLGVISVGHAARDYPIRPVPFTAVDVDDVFWSPRLETNRKVTIPYAFGKCEETGRIANFARAGRLEEGGFEGTFFNDSDVAKVVEGAAYALAVRRDPKLEEYVDGVVAKIIAAQEDDGYLYTARTLQDDKYKPPGGKERWSNISGGHELYCVGHMYEASVAWYRATGKRNLLDAMIKNADLICSVFGPGKRTDPPGHQEIEIGLVRLYRITGDEKYLRQAKFFLDQRGREGNRGLNGKRGLYGKYSQDHIPVVEQSEAVGHAVRAGYMYSGMADIAALTGDQAYLDAIQRIWHDVVGGKIYITGSIGQSRHLGEAFDEAYKLPNRTAYAETCGAVANALWNYRMFLLFGESKYIDVLERIIYNGFLSGVGLSGDRFFYPNPLSSTSGASRSAWFGCACCPSNVCRFVPSIPGYAYAYRDDDVYVNLFIAGRASVKLEDKTVNLTQETRYPWDGSVKMTIDSDKQAEFALCIRIPGWARNEVVAGDLYSFVGKIDQKPAIKVNGKAVSLKMDRGYARIRRRWNKGDVVRLDLPMPVRRVIAHEKVEADKDRVALQRGPIVYCLEWPDNKGGNVMGLMIPDDVALAGEFRKGLLGGVAVVKGKAFTVARQKGKVGSIKWACEFTAIPYYAWAHRGAGEMTVWAARRENAVNPMAAPTIAFKSKATASYGGTLKALSDQLEPKSSIDHDNRYWHVWPHKGTKEWVQYDFDKVYEVSKVKVYWFDDTGMGACRQPESWRLLWKDGDDWKPVKNKDEYGTAKDTYNTVRFEPVKTSALKIEIQSQEKFAMGIHEWIVE